MTLRELFQYFSGTNDVIISEVISRYPYTTQVVATLYGPVLDSIPDEYENKEVIDFRISSPLATTPKLLVSISS